LQQRLPIGFSVNMVTQFILKTITRNSVNNFKKNSLNYFWNPTWCWCSQGKLNL